MKLSLFLFFLVLFYLEFYLELLKLTFRNNHYQVGTQSISYYGFNNINNF